MAQMQNNMSFTAMGFKGGQTINGFPVEGQAQVIQTVGGIFSTAAGNDTFEAYFGRVVSADTATPNEFLIGKVGAVVRGIVLYNPSIASNEPFKRDYYLKGTPMVVATGGEFRYQSWTKTAVGAIDPVIGCKVIFKDADGTIEFVGSATAVPANWTQLALNGRNAQVVDVDTFGGAVINI